MQTKVAIRHRGGPQVGRLEQQLRASLKGDVRFDGATRSAYASDSSNYRHVPIGVVFPKDEEDVAAALAVCRAADVPVVGRGAGTSLAGQACNEAVVLDFSRYMNQILELDVENRRARIQPGIVLDDLQRVLAPYGLAFGPDPATHAYCTLGGMIGNNSCGTHALYAGKTVDNVERLIAWTYDGERLDVGAFDPAAYDRAVAEGGELARILRSLRSIAEHYEASIRTGFPDIPRRVSGFNLDELLTERGFHVARALVGTESNCVLVTEATIQLTVMPPTRRLLVLGFPDVYQAADYVPELLKNDGLLGLEGFDDTMIQHMRNARLNLASLELLPAGGGWLLAEFGADDEKEADALAAAALRSVPSSVDARIFSSPEEQRGIWVVRESGLGATAHPPGAEPHHEGWEDAGVPPARLGEYLRGVKALWDEFGYNGAWYGHFGQGCVHTRNDFDFSNEAGLAKFRAFMERAADFCVSLGGSLSGEHGDGQARGELWPRMFSPELMDAFREFKAVFDPRGRMNPGNTIDARPLDENLKVGPDRPITHLVPTKFTFPDDHGSLQLATERCVGVGRCRRDDLGTMCPSFRATRDEVHSTRGRAKIMAEMFRDEMVPATWRSHEVHEALELCLSCKGCVVDCPTHVDMATYKAEFNYHHYRNRLRPRAEYVLGLLPWLARPATAAPRLANALLGDHAAGRAVRSLLGLTTSRPAPRLAKRPFRRRGHASATGSATVVLWPDTFSDLYRPERAEATKRVLEAAGERVAIPEDWGCCGRPLFDPGMLDLARHSLLRVLNILDPWISAEVPVVVPEPSCLATFKDELPRLLPDDPRAAALSRLATNLAGHLLAREWIPRRTVSGARAAVHPHCHQRATVGSDADAAILRRAGYEVEVLDTGCCGLAGSFGFNARTAEVAGTIAGQKFLPAVSSLGEGTRLVTDGFSCALQSEQLAGVAGASVAELLEAAIG